MRRAFMVSVVVGVALAGCGDDSTGPDGLTPVAALSIADLPDTLFTRQTFRLTASAADDDGRILPDRPLAWASSDPDVVSITAGGTLTALAPGVAIISVSTDAAADSATVAVRALAFAHVIAGGTISCGLEASGQAWCWGNNVSPFGGGFINQDLSPVPAPVATGRHFASLAMAFTSICGLELSHSVVCWGAGGGQLTQGTNDSNTPLTVPGVTNVVQLVAGLMHYCARTSAGSVYCWGSNEWKQTGLPARSPASAPHEVPLTGPATDLTAGDYHTCALVSGVSYCWGADDLRQLGNDTTYDRLIPVLAATGDGVQRTWTDIQAVAQNTCARDDAGAIFCWGILEEGTNFAVREWLPARQFLNVVTTTMADGWFIRCALDGQRDVWCVRDGPDPEPQLTASDVRTMAIAGDNPCLLSSAGTVACHFPGFPEDSLMSVPLPASSVRLTATAGMACSLDASNAVYCWPTSYWMQVGKPTQWFSGHAVSSLFANGDDRVCIIATDATVWCRDDYSPDETAEPTGGQAFDSLAVGQNHTCGLTVAGAAWCWGRNDHGQLGDGSTADHTAAVAVQGGHSFVQIAAGWNHTCGRTAAGEIWCWGYGSDGQMADDHRDESATPVTVDGLPPLSAIAENCGLSAGSAWCWPTSRALPEHEVAGATDLVTLGGLCGLRQTGALLCWGTSYYGVFGTGTYDNTYTAAVAAGSGILFRQLSLTTHGTACGIALDGTTYCWGSGYGTVPVKMIGAP